MLPKIFTYALNLFSLPEFERGMVFGEHRLLFFANGSEGKGEGGSGSDTKDDTEMEEEEVREVGEDVEEKPPEIKIPGEKYEEEVTPEIKEISEGTAARYEDMQQYLDRLEAGFVPEIDQKKLKEARNVVNGHIIELDKYNKNIDGLIDDILLSKLGIAKEKKERAHDLIVATIFKNISEFTPEQLKKDTIDFSKLIPANHNQKLYVKIKPILEKFSGKPVPAPLLTAYINNITKNIPDILEHEFKMLKAIYEVKEVMSDMRDKIQRKLVQERMKKDVGKYVGFPIKEGQILEAEFIREIPDGKGSYYIKKYPQRWKVRKVYIDKVGKPEYEIDKYKDEKMYFNGVWVDLEDLTGAGTGSGRFERMPLFRLKKFVNVHDITPMVKRAEDLPDAVPYLKAMRINIKPDMELEYEEMVRDENGVVKPEPRKLKIVSVSEGKIKLDKEILYRSRFESPDLAHHEMKSELTYGEFAKWLNQRTAIPPMDTETLQSMLNRHSQFMIDEYKLNKNCHRPINLEEGEILYADAPGNPIYEIVSITPELGGTITIKIAGKEERLTFPQFIRWVYQNDIEPYDPELQALRAQVYLGAKKKDLPKIRERAQRAIDHFQKDGIWKDTLDDLEKREKAKGGGDIHRPKMPKMEDLMGKPKGIKSTIPSRSFFKELWRETVILRLDDIFELFKSGWEYYSRNWKRRQKFRYSSVGKNLPWFGTEFERVNQSAENEEVNQFKEAMEQWGVWQVEETLEKTGNKDQAKACLKTLAEKGMIRWDNPKIWRTLNRFAGSSRQIPIPAEGEDPYHPYDEKDPKIQQHRFLGQKVIGKTGMDLLPEVIDSLWGEGTYNEWKRQNDGAIEDGVQKAYSKGQELENDPKNIGGISRELSILLGKHMNGEYVDPQEFEGLLRFIMDAGKGTAEDKVYYLLMGTTAENPKTGKTILGWERIGVFISKMCNQFPVVDFFTDKDLKRDPNNPKKIVKRAWIKSDFQKWTESWIETARKDNYQPNEDVTKFLWRDTLTSDAYQIRLEKGIRNAENMDHDDTQMFIPALKEEEIESVTSNTGGNKKKFTIQGYKNAYVGFGMRLKYLLEKIEDEESYQRQGDPAFTMNYVKKVTDLFRSFVRYDAVLDYRYLRDKGGVYQRFSDADYNTPCVVDSLHPIRIHQGEMQQLTRKILKAYKVDQEERFVLPFISAEEIPKKDRKKAEEYIKYFGRNFSKVVMSDNGAQMLKVVKNALTNKEITGMDVAMRMPPEEKAMNKIKFEMEEAQKVAIEE